MIGRVNDWSSSGNYLIYSCGSQVEDVKNILEFTYLFLQTAMRSTGGPAYKAFFRSADPNSVNAIINGITAGTNVTTKSHGSRRPNLVCANALDPGIRSFWNLCQDSPNTVLIQPPDTSIVFLCPIFFQRPTSPQSEECATVNRAKTKLISHSNIAGSQYSYMVLALADIYIRAALQGKMSLSVAVRDESHCLALPPDQALRNPSSYTFYASSK